MIRASASWLGRWRSPVLTLLRIALSVLPLWWLSRRIDVGSILLGIQRVGPSRLGCGLAIHLGIMTVLSARWRILLATYRATRLPSVGYLLRANLVANYFALLPVPAADEGVRVLRTLPYFSSGRVTPYLVLVAERLTGLTGLLLVALLSSSLVSDGTTTDSLRRAFALGCLIALTLAVPVLALPSLTTRWPALQGRIAAIPLVGKQLGQLESPLRRSDLVLSVLLSLIGHFGWCAVIALLFAPLDSTATLAVCTRVHPLVLLAMSIPVTPAGVGQRELVFATLYGLAGVNPASAVTVALLSFSLGLAQQAIGGAVYLIERLFLHEPPSQALTGRPDDAA